jgi:hypothetical protein
VEVTEPYFSNASACSTPAMALQLVSVDLSQNKLKIPKEELLTRTQKAFEETGCFTVTMGQGVSPGLPNYEVRLQLVSEKKEEIQESLLSQTEEEVYRVHLLAKLMPGPGAEGREYQVSGKSSTTHSERKILGLGGESQNLEETRSHGLKLAIDVLTERLLGII